MGAKCLIIRPKLPALGFRSAVLEMILNYIIEYAYSPYQVSGFLLANLRIVV